MSDEQEIHVTTYGPDGSVVEDVDTRTLDGEKTRLLADLGQRMAAALLETDGYVVRQSETGKAIPSDVAAARSAARAAKLAIENRILAAASVAELDADQWGTAFQYALSSALHAGESHAKKKAKGSPGATPNQPKPR